jgi:hypothetical protein
LAAAQGSCAWIPPVLAIDGRPTGMNVEVIGQA